MIPPPKRPWLRLTLWTQLWLLPAVAFAGLYAFRQNARIQSETNECQDCEAQARKTVLQKFRTRLTVAPK
jgi:hypothetical protein